MPGGSRPVTIADLTGPTCAVRRGDIPLAEILDAIRAAEARREALRDSPAVPDQPDRSWVDGWLHRSYLDFWARAR